MISFTTANTLSFYCTHQGTPKLKWTEFSSTTLCWTIEYTCRLIPDTIGLLSSVPTILFIEYCKRNALGSRSTMLIVNLSKFIPPGRILPGLPRNPVEKYGDDFIKFADNKLGFIAFLLEPSLLSSRSRSRLISRRYHQTLRLWSTSNICKYKGKTTNHSLPHGSWKILPKGIMNRNLLPQMTQKRTGGDC